MIISTRLRILGIGLLLAALPLLALPLLHKEITILVDDRPARIRTYALTVAQALRGAGIPLTEADEITPPLDHRLHDGDQIVIRRAIPLVLFVDGKTQHLLTGERIPVIILAEAGVALSPQDRLLADGLPISLDTPLAPGRPHSLQVVRARKVQVQTPEENLSLNTTAATTAQALWDADLPLYAGDELTPAGDLANPVRWIPARTVTVRSPNASVTVRTTAATVGEALAEAGIALVGQDYTIPPLDAPLPENGQIDIVRVREEVEIEQTLIPFATLQQPLPDLEIDKTQVVQAGAFGLKAQRIRRVLEQRAGETTWTEVSRQVEDEWEARPAQPRIVGYGTKINVQTLNTPDGVIEYWRAVEVYATSYSPCRLGVPGRCNSTTASGAQLQKGVIAVKRSWYNMMRGLRVYIPGYGFATIEDVGAGVPGKHWIDLGYSDEDWVQWSRNVTLYFLTPVPANVMWILE